MKDLGFSESWPEGGIERRLVENTAKAGCVFSRERENGSYKYTCKEAGLVYHSYS